MPKKDDDKLKQYARKPLPEDVVNELTTEELETIQTLRILDPESVAIRQKCAEIAKHLGEINNGDNGVWYQFTREYVGEYGLEIEWEPKQDDLLKQRVTVVLDLGNDPSCRVVTCKITDNEAWHIPGDWEDKIHPLFEEACNVVKEEKEKRAQVARERVLKKVVLGG